MAWYSSKRATTVFDDGEGFMACVYHQTKVVRWSRDTVVLNSNGFQTATTKTRMNEVSQEYGLGYHVFQKDHEWYVELPSGKVVDFNDGMRIER